MELKAMKWIVGATALALVFGQTPARAEYPEKPVEMTVLFGGTAQTIGQLLADLMSKNLPNPVVPVARTGGGGSVGYKYVNATDPDGYNIVWNSNSISTGYHGGRTDFDYTAFKPIARISVEVPAFAVRADAGWETLQDMVDDIKSSDKKLKVGASGKGSFTHLTTMALLDKLGIADKVIHVPYDQGKAPVELLAGRIDAALQWPGQFISHAEAGTINILCVTGKDRITALPDVPSCAEAGAGDLDITMWRGLAAPADTPDEVIAILEAAAKTATGSEEFIAASKTVGFEPAFADHAQFGEQIAADDKWIGELIKDLGLNQ
ncbi:Bug family tripartite tricarboxylate transporter substrate binding protein [Microbaculum marinisediminis]|uniref:Tripartite tricarboxylate transporter substrate binding protein n=1 Tax=Microbaculum marinisediminis TaxID=2931392 RepID=A0AAW5R1Q6_9HYPH|nr:tripartite tricarboxylate transporter substrate binding protein [Microbaculum sp. A6E488]MCT8973908.1 tripartite tricarboxylate transporter substrate binding protein [Microbaculum sp. A6E488]